MLAVFSLHLKDYLNILICDMLLGLSKDLQYPKIGNNLFAIFHWIWDTWFLVLVLFYFIVADVIQTIILKKD